MDGDIIYSYADRTAAYAAHLGIATGLCLSEAASRYMPRLLKDLILLTAMLAAVATAMAEILGGAIALQNVVPYTNQTGEYPDPGSGIILCIYECI